jgi:hypothetical protein
MVTAQKTQVLGCKRKERPLGTPGLSPTSASFVSARGPQGSASLAWPACGWRLRSASYCSMTPSTPRSRRRWRAAACGAYRLAGHRQDHPVGGGRHGGAGSRAMRRVSADYGDGRPDDLRHHRRAAANRPQRASLPPRPLPRRHPAVALAGHRRAEPLRLRSGLRAAVHHPVWPISCAALRGSAGRQAACLSG